MRAALLCLFLVMNVGPVIAGKHPSMFFSDLASSPTDLVAGDPNEGIAVPQPSPESWSRTDRTTHNFRFYDTLTTKRMAVGRLADRCGKVVRRSDTKAYVVDIAEGSTPVRGPHWKDVLTNGATVVKVTVSPGNHKKLLYLRATNRVIWNIEGNPSAIYLYGPSYLGAAAQGIPVYSAMHATKCKTRGGLPRDVRRHLSKLRDEAMLKQMNSGGLTLAKAPGMMAELNGHAKLVSGMLVETTSGAEIAEHIVKTRAKQIDF